MLLQTPHTFTDDRAFQHTGHRDQPFDIGQVQTHSQRTTDHGITLGEAEFFSRDLTDQREPIYSDVRQQRPEGDKVDIIFDLTGNSDVRQALRNKLMESKNHHTVIAPAVVAQLLWCFFDEDRELPGADRHNAGY